jgi:hypothetical protein
MIRVTTFALVLIASAAAAQAQQPAVSFVPLEQLAIDIRQAAGTPSDQRQASIASALQENTSELALYALGSIVYTSLVEEGRIDKQVGTSSSSPGSTTLVSRGSVPSIIGVAVESGALYQSVNGNVVTLRVNPAGLAQALAKGSYLLSGPRVSGTAFETAIGKLSGSASFDLQQGSSPGMFTAERSQLKEAAVRYDVVNKRDPRHPSHAGAVRQLRGNLSDVVSVVQAYFDILKKIPGYDAWRLETAAALAAVDSMNDAALKAALDKAGDDYIRRFAATPELQRLGRSLVDNIKLYRSARDKAFASIAKSTVFTVEYAFAKLTVPDATMLTLPAGTVLPDVSTARAILSSPLGTIGEATLNASTTLFNSTLPGMNGPLRDIQVAGSVEVKLPEMQTVGQMVLTFAGLGVFLHQQPFGVKVKIRDLETADGTIGVFQTKLTIPAGRSGVQIPVSVTFANRSEFNTESDVRGAIGLTFDLDKLFAR